MDFIDQNCNPPVFDKTTFPVGSAALDPNFNILPFLCQLMQNATNPNIDPVLAQAEPYDYSPLVNFSALTAIGDHRFSDGAVFQAAFTNFLPKIIAQVEIKQAGGTQIIDNYICDSDGNPIKKTESVAAMTSIGNGNVNLLGYDIPSLDPATLTSEINQEAVENYILSYMDDNRQAAAQDFVTYLELFYNPGDGWNYTLNHILYPSFFYVQLDYIINNKVDHTVYLKYHDDAKEIVAQLLNNLGIISSTFINFTSSTTFSNNALARAFSLPVPDYTKLLSENRANDVLENAAFATSPNTNYKNMINSLASQVSAGNLSQQAFDIINFTS
jgi:hypothetical protein